MSDYDWIKPGAPVRIKPDAGVMVGRRAKGYITKRHPVETAYWLVKLDNRDVVVPVLPDEIERQS